MALKAVASGGGGIGPSPFGVQEVLGNIVNNDNPQFPVVTQVQANWQQSDDTEVDYIKFKPTLGTIASQDADDVDITGGSIDGTVIGAIDAAAAQFLMPVNHQTGTTYTIALTDCSSIVTFNNASAVTVTLPQQSTTTTAEGFNFVFINLGAGAVTFVTQGAETIIGTVVIPQNGIGSVFRDTTTQWAVNLSSNQTSGVQAVSGNIVDNTDPQNPVITQVQSDWDQTDNGEPDYIQNKPALGTIASQDADDVTITGGSINDTILGNVTQSTAQFLKNVNHQTGTTYTVQASDCSNLITFNNASGVTVTLPQQSTITTVEGFAFDFINLGAGDVTFVVEGSETLIGTAVIPQNGMGTVNRDTSTQWASNYSSAIAGVEAVTGNIVDNTDPANPVVTQVQSNWLEGDSDQPDYIKFKPALGTISTQDADAVAITGGNIDGTVIGASVPADGTFTFINVSTTDGITAAGTDRSTATALTTQINNVTTVASGTGVVLPDGVLGGEIYITNNGAHPLQVYAPGSDTLNGISGTTGITLAIGQTTRFEYVASTVWLANINSYGVAVYSAVVDDISGTYTIDPAKGNYFELTVTGDVTISFGATPDATNGSEEQTILLKLLGDGGIVTWDNDGTINFISGCTPIQDAFNPIYIQFNGHQGVWDGTVGNGYALPQTIAGGSTINLDVISSNLITISGTASITEIITTSGLPRQVKFSGASTLVNSSNLVLPNDGSNITTAAGDTAVFLGFTGSSVTTCVNYTRADGGTPFGTLGSMAYQDADAVAITGGTVDDTVIGGTTRAAGNFTFARQDANASVTAAGTDQSTATALTDPINYITTAASGTGVKLPPAVEGSRVSIYNFGDNDVLVYTDSTETYNGVPGSVGIAIAPTQSLMFEALSSSEWAFQSLSGMAYQDPAGILVTGGLIDGTPIGNNTPASGTFTYVKGSVGNALTAAGTDQSTALALTNQVNIITTVASGTGVKLPVPAVGMRITVFNNGANVLKLYSDNTATINGGSGATGITIPVGVTYDLFAVTTGAWQYEPATAFGVDSVTSSFAGFVDNTDAQNPVIDYVQPDWDETDNTAVGYIQNKPDLALEGIVTDTMGSTYTADPDAGSVFVLTWETTTTLNIDTPTLGADQTQTLQFVIIPASGADFLVFGSNINLVNANIPLVDPTIGKPTVLTAVWANSKWQLTSNGTYQDTVTIASATSISLDGTGAAIVHVTGTATISGIGCQTGILRVVVFDDAGCTLLYDPIGIILPGQDDIVTQAGDIALFIGLLSDPNAAVYCVSYFRADGTPIAPLGTMATQDADDVAITGGAIDGTVIGGTTPAAGTFTYSQQSVNDSVTAAGTNQSTATALTAAINNVATAASGTGVKLPVAVTGMTIDVYNNGANNVHVYSDGSETLNGSPGSLGVLLQNGGKAFRFQATSSSAWNYAAIGTIAYQNANSITVTGGLLDSVIIGANTPLTGNFTYAKQVPANSISAAGTDRSTATALNSAINNITTVASGTGVKLPAISAGQQITIYNNGANALQIYTLSSETINGISGATGISLAAGSALVFDAISSSAYLTSSTSIIGNPTYDLGVVQASSTTDLDATYDNGSSGVGATLTANDNEVLIVDGYTVSVNEAVLVLSQATGSENGIYICTDAGSGSTPWILERASYYDSGDAILQGTKVFTVNGSTYRNANFYLSTANPVTVGTTDLIFFPDFVNLTPIFDLGAVKAVTTGSNLSASYNNGTGGVGATLTSTSNGTLTLDGQAITAGDYVGIFDQSTQLQNGIYLSIATGDGSNPWVLQRASYFDSSSQMRAGVQVRALSGTLYAGAEFYLSANVVTVGTSNIVFEATNNVPGLGTMATQDADDVAITGGDIGGVTTTQIIDTVHSDTVTGTYSIDPTLAGIFKLTVDASTTFSMASSYSSGSGQRIVLELIMGTGAVTFDLAWTGITWINGQVPNISQLDGDTTFIELIAVDTTWYANVISTAQESTAVASSSTIDLDIFGNNVILISGTSSISTLINDSGVEKTLIFTDAATLVHSSDLVLPTGANIVTAAGDVVKVVGHAYDSVVYCTSYLRANGEPLVDGGVQSVTGNLVDNTDPDNPTITVYPLEPVVVCQYGIGSFSYSYNNGSSGVGATLTNAGAQAALVIDGITLSVGQRVLWNELVTLTHNGIYEVTATGSPSTNWVLTRTTDYDTTAKILYHTTVQVTTGTYAGSTFYMANNTSITVGTTDVPFTLMGGFPFGSMAYQNLNAVNITGGTIDGVAITTGSINNTPIGSTTPALGTFTFAQVSATNTITAAGTNQSTATALTASINHVTTVANGTGVKLPAGATGKCVVVFNDGANDLKVYSASSETINGGSGATGVTLFIGESYVFYAISASAWLVSLIKDMAYQASDSIDVTGGTIDGTVIGSLIPVDAQFLTPVNAQTGTTYTLAASDCGKEITFSNASAITVTLPKQATAVTPQGFWCRYKNLGAGTVTFVTESGDTSDGNLTAITNASGVIYRNTTTNWSLTGGSVLTHGIIPFFFPGTIANTTGYYITMNAPHSFTIDSATQVAGSLGTAGTYTVTINGTNVTSLATVTNATSRTTTNATGANSVVAGDYINFSVDSTVNAVNYYMQINYSYYQNV